MYYELDSVDAEEWDTLYNNLRDGTVIILLYMNGCQFCESMKKEWDKFISEISKSNHKIPVYRVLDAVKNNLPSDILKYVSGYPTILSVNHNKMVKMYPETLERNVDNFMKFYNEIEHQMNNGENTKKNLNILNSGGKKKKTHKKRKNAYKKKTKTYKKKTKTYKKKTKTYKKK